MPNLYKLNVPIPNYYGDDVFYQSLYIMANTCPRRADWIELASGYHVRDMEYPEYTNGRSSGYMRRIQ